MMIPPYTVQPVFPDSDCGKHMRLAGHGGRIRGLSHETPSFQRFTRSGVPLEVTILTAPWIVREKGTFSPTCECTEQRGNAAAVFDEGCHAGGRLTISRLWAVSP